MSFEIEVESGKTVKLTTAGKYCDRDILVTATGYTENDLQMEYNIGYSNGRIDEETAFLEGLPGCKEIDADVSSIAPYALAGKSGLETIRLTSLKTSLGGSAFRECEQLKEVHLPKYASDSNGYFFAKCGKLAFVDFGSPACVSRYAFQDCAALKTIILRKNGVVPLNNSNAFSGVSGVTIYVPSEVIGKYKGAANWAGLVSAGKVTFAELKGSGYE